jgi:aspartate kinase
MFAALAEAGINIQMITTSEIKISALVERDQALNALRVVHHVFELDKEPEQVPADADLISHKGEGQTDISDLLERLQGTDMEELVLNDISLDENQALVTVVGVPDRPGIAAKVFEEVAAAGIFVDMIVQSYKGYQGQTNVSFTVPREKLAESLKVAEQLSAAFDCQEVAHCPAVAKLSVSGIGLRSHTSVAIRMFRSLAESGINIEMISTSEVLVNVVVDGHQGQQGLAKLQEAFSDVLR